MEVLHEGEVLFGEAEEIGELGGAGGGDKGAFAAAVVVEGLVGDVDFLAFCEDAGLSGDVFVDVPCGKSNTVPQFSSVELGPEVEGGVLFEKELF